ncbi:MAG: hypothetical protein ACJAT1_001045 [Marivirga sp.]|jgi:hypothetical protein
MNRFSLYIILGLLSISVTYAQETEMYDYGREFLFGGTTATNSGLISGGFFRYGEKVSDKVLRTIGIEIANIRHPQERKVSTGFYGASVYEGKDNYLISTRLMYGYDRILFRKADRKGVQINAVGMGGPSIGLISPYYLRSESGNLITYSDYLASPVPIIGSANYFTGIKEMEATLGFHLRGSLLFEFGTFKSSITGFEVGGLIEYFAREVPLVPAGTKNYNFYPSLFLSVIFGSRK